MKADASSRFVIDASVAVCWCFEDKKTPYTEEILGRMEEAEIFVPSIWPFEITNALLMAERRKRITASQSTVFLEQLENFNIVVDQALFSRIFGRLFDEARQWGLTSYDAAYLELALRQGLHLATLDDQLKKAAKAMGVLIAR